MDKNICYDNICGIKKTNVRWALLSMVYFTCLIAYLDRVNLSVCAPAIMADFGFDKVQLGLTMSAFFIAYAVTQIPGALLAERFGIRATGTLAMGWWSVFTVLTPFAWNFWSFFAVRAAFGAGEGPMFPNNGAFIARWFSPREKAIPNSIMLSGAFIGPALGPPIAVAIMTLWGWQMVFYIFGGVGLAAAIIWHLCARDYPQQHSGVNEAELEHIVGSETKTIEKAGVAPWKLFLKSPQFWCLGLQYLAVNYIFYLFLSWLPMYLVEARGLSLARMGLAAAIPWVALAVGLIVSGIVSDRLIARGSSKFRARSVMAMAGLTLCGIGLYQAANSATLTENVFWLTVSLGCLSGSYTGAWAACQDLGKKFGGSTVAWMNTWGTIAGILAPTVTALLVNAIGWQAALNGSSVVVAFGVLFWLFVKPDKPLLVETKTN